MDAQPRSSRAWHRRPPGWRIIRIVWAFVAIVGCLLAFAYYSIGLMSAGRAYVGGEGLWSKAQKESVAALSRYAMGQAPGDYQAYQDALAVILGDRQARTEMERATPELGLATQGFLQGRNHPQDVEGMINLFLRFGKLPEIERAVTAWVQADQLIDQLIALGTQLHADVQAGTLKSSDSMAYQQKIQQLNMQLTPLEDEFSYALGEASRKTTTVLRIAMLVTASVMVAIAYLFSVRMVQQSEKIHRALQNSENQLRKMLQFAPLPILIVRTNSDSFVYANQRALAQLGITNAMLHSVKPQDFYVQPQDRTPFIEAISTQGSVRDWEVQMQDAQGTPFWALISAQRTVFGGKECLLTSMTNINELKQAQEALHHRAFHDELTGLPNRAMFMDALSRILHRMTRKSGTFSILFIDLDHFKEVNDTLGHAMGDLLLQEVAMRIRVCVREGDLVARLGGDEFVILLEDNDRAHTMPHIAQKIQKTLEPPHQLGEHAVQATASIGISTYPLDGTDITTLLRHADNAMYSVKTEGGNSVSQFSSIL